MYFIINRYYSYFTQAKINYIFNICLHRKEISILLSLDPTATSTVHNNSKHTQDEKTYRYICIYGHKATYLHFNLIVTKIFSIENDVFIIEVLVFYDIIFEYATETSAGN